MIRSAGVAGALVVLCGAFAAAGCDPVEGSATITGQLTISDCRASMPVPSSDISFSAGYISTERYSNALLISMQKYRVEVEESDGLVVRFPLGALLDSGALIIDRDRGKIVRADASSALLVRTSTNPNDANVALSLFQTCPEFPTSYASSGQISIDKLTLSANPDDTGEGERIGGTLTAIMTRVSSKAPVGSIEAVFDFAPPRRPLTDFK